MGSGPLPGTSQSRPDQEGLIPQAKAFLSNFGNPVNQGKQIQDYMSGSGPGGVLGLPGAAPEQANIQQATNIGNVQQAQQGVTNALSGQQGLLAALQNQGGLGMQNTAAANQQGLANQLQAANGVGAQQGAISGLQNTAGMYQNIAQGRGPNPAQAMLNQATGQNVANQAALMAGQRGAGANVGLMARQAGQQGAGIQQQAVGQGATMQANQQLNALQGLTGAQQAIGGLGSGLTNQQMGANQAYANQANQIAGQQIGQVNANTQANLANQNAMQGTLQGINNSNVASQASVNTGNVELSKANTAAKQKIIGGATNALGEMGQMFGSGGGGEAEGARGGMVHMADGGPMTPMNPAPVQNMTPMNPGPSSSFGQFVTNNQNDNQKASSDLVQQQTNEKSEPIKDDEDSKKKSGVNMGQIASIAALALLAKGGLAQGGGKVAAKSSSQKAEKSGNSYSNDKIPAMLSEGEIVLPRSVTQSKDPQTAAAKFVAQVIARRNKK